ncbi:MAG TPA: hypothetical protein VIF83_15995 [Gemmatimonadaceae bacterium]
MTPAKRRLQVALIVTFAAAGSGAGCASRHVSGSSSSRDVAATVTPPLASMAGRPVVVLPTQYVTYGNRVAARDADSSTALLMRIVDDEIALSLRSRGVTQWTSARDISASARRNMGLTADPHALSALQVRRITRASEDPLPEPFASQVRSLTALRDARYALLPIELRRDITTVHPRGTLRLFLIDSRTARIVWVGEVSGESSEMGSELERVTAFAKVLAGRVADLVTAG